jgi:tetratricopeptide (TPR) repeat protein
MNQRLGGDQNMAASDGVEGIVGAEGDGGDSQSGIAQADAVAMAIAIDQARHDPELSRKVGDYVEKQTKLVDVQIRHIDEERRLAIEAAKRKRYGDRIRNGLITGAAVIACSLVVGLAIMVWDAAHDTGLVIESFAVPPDLAQQGMTGQAVANQILDEIADIQISADTPRPAASYASNWGNDLKVEIPETGVSIGELDRFLRTKLGHITRINGTIYRTSDGLTVVARAGEVSNIVITGREQDLGALLRETAEVIYSRTQPYRYAVWLTRHDRFDEAMQAMRRLLNVGDSTDRLWALSGLGSFATNAGEARSILRFALQLQPTFIQSWVDLAQVEEQSGNDEAALAVARKATELLSSGSASAKISREWLPGDVHTARAVAQTMLGDYLAAAAEMSAWADQAPQPLRRFLARRRGAVALVRAHDLGPGILGFGITSTSWEAPLAGGANGDNTYVLSVLIAVEQGDWDQVVKEVERLKALHLPLGTQQSFPSMLDPTLAEAYARTGRSSEADALLNSIPLDVYDGWRARGRIAALRNDSTNAEHAFTEAVHRAPSIPRAYKDWGDLLVLQGDAAGAIVKYVEANKRGPQWADPLKAWGDVLAKQGDGKEALAKYDEALKYAPHWKQLQDARDALVKQKT